jgi:hypothetical protein
MFALGLQFLHRVFECFFANPESENTYGHDVDKIQQQLDRLRAMN